MRQRLAQFRASEPALSTCAAIATALCAALFLLQGRVGLNLQDEAFLWYGAMRTHVGELPLRDFRSYDPGRYVWCAPWIAAFGDGIVAVRAAGWAFASVGTTAGLLVVARTTRHVGSLALAGLVLVAWIAPPWKPYESATAMIVAWAAVRLVENPTARRTFVAGIVVGAAAFFGRNMGVYAGIAMIAVALAACFRARTSCIRALAALAGGTLAGYAPMIALVLFADGYREAFFESIAFYGRQGALNAQMPFPFPWRPPTAALAGIGTGSAFTVGSLFLVLPIAYVAAIAAFLVARARASDGAARLFALACVGLTWFHHASVRSDLWHLAQSIHPFLLGVLCLPGVVPAARATVVRVACTAALVVVTAMAIARTSPVYLRALAPPGREYERVVVGRDELWLSPVETQRIRALESIVAAHVAPDEELWVTAQGLALYPVLGRRAPTWDIYPAWAADDREQERMSRELAGVRWALVDTRPIGGDAQMKFELSHPRVWRRLLEEFERVPLADAPATLVLLRRR